MTRQNPNNAKTTLKIMLEASTNEDNVHKNIQQSTGLDL